MSDFQHSPTWVSDKMAGSDMAYQDQNNGNFNLEKDLETELGLFEAWKKLEGDGFSPTVDSSTKISTFKDYDVEPFKRRGRPCLVSISGYQKSGYWVPSISGDDQFKYGIAGVDIATSWYAGGPGEWEATIPYHCKEKALNQVEGKDYYWGGHRKGRILGNRTGEASDFIIPRVKVYVYTGATKDIILGDGGRTECFEELGDSPEISIRTGDIVIRSKNKDLIYLVVIY